MRAWTNGTCNLSQTVASVAFGFPGTHGIAPTIRRNGPLSVGCTTSAFRFVNAYHAPAWQRRFCS